MNKGLEQKREFLVLEMSQVNGMSKISLQNFGTSQILIILTSVHIRIHPLLGWTEIDIWKYIKEQKIPIVDLYFSKNGKRYRSLGDQDITFPVDSNASNVDEIIEELKITKISERSGRAMDHEQEDVFEKLRTKGYM